MERTELSFYIGNKFKWNKVIYLPTKLCEWITIFGKWSANKFPSIVEWKDK